MWIAGPEDSFQDVILRSATTDQASFVAAKAVVAALSTRASAGQDLFLPGSPGEAAHDLTVLENTADALDAAGSVRAAEGSGSVVTAAVPSQFELRGYAETIYSWFFKMEIDAGFCADTCQITDIVRQKWHLNPGRTGDVFSWTSIYSPNQGNLKNIYADGYVYCNGSSCGHDLLGEGGARDGTGSGSSTISHSSNAGGQQVDAVRLRATLVPNSTTYFDYAKTGTANCGTGSNRNCIW